MKKGIAIALCSLLISCGSYIKTSDQGEKVRHLNQGEVSSCKHLGKTTVSVLDKVAFIERKETSVEENLQTLARNSAAEMHGDTIVTASLVKDGKQTYDIYKCVNPNGK